MRLVSTKTRSTSILTDPYSDPLPWLFLGRQGHLCSGVKFVDVDYPALMQKKVEIIKRTHELTDLLPDVSFTTDSKGVLCDSSQYAVLGCDLRDLLDLRRLLADQGVSHDSASILFTAEVSIAYMDMPGSQAVIEFAHEYHDARFCLLEQHLPDGKDHPFAKTMLSHFDKIRTPLHTIGTIADMKQRFMKAGWREGSIDIRSLWHLWSDSTFLTGQEKRALDQIEPFDEWEEFALFCSHYFLLVTRSCGDLPQRMQEEYSHALCTGIPIVCEDVQTASCQRRFAALSSNYLADTGEGELLDLRYSIHSVIAGLGKQERLTDTASFVVGGQETMDMPGPPLTQGMMCHTVTNMNNSDILLVGGRTSPDRACADCWLRDDKGWRQVQPLPQGRYRHCVIYCSESGTTNEVLLFGGKSSSGQLFSSFMRWDERTGWNEVESNITIKARFGATMIRTTSMDRVVRIMHGGDAHTDGPGVGGLLLGGMDDDCNICQDIWHWSLDKTSNKIQLSPYRHFHGAQSELLHLHPICRFGAQTLLWSGYSEGDTTDSNENELFNPMLVGGIGCHGLIPRDFEFYNIGTGQPHPIRGQRPLCVGNSIDQHDWRHLGSKTTRLSFGGGATCFSFGTYWNRSLVAFHPENVAYEVTNWQPRPEPRPARVTYEEDSTPPAVVTQVQIIEAPLPGPELFQHLLKDDKPVILRGCNLGPCTSLWTPEYLKSTLGDRQVVVHSSNTAKMDFQAKNFRYEVRNFGDFIDGVLAGELLYMRALSSMAPTEKPTELSLDFPQIAKDFLLPPELKLVDENVHSRPLRISGRTIMWLHYDVMANVLCQIRGHKTLMLYPPSDVPHLEIEPGMSSSSIDVFNADASPSLRRCYPYEARLQPGDILFIPALWLHAAAPTDGLSIAVNVFFRHLKDGYAAGKDVYGNRDLAAYERGRRDVARIIKSFNGLSVDDRDRCLKQLSSELESEDANATTWSSASSDKARDVLKKARKDVARIRKSFASLPKKETAFYLTRLVLELRRK